MITGRAWNTVVLSGFPYLFVCISEGKWADDHWCRNSNAYDSIHWLMVFQSLSFIMVFISHHEQIHSNFRLILNWKTPYPVQTHFILDNAADWSWRVGILYSWDWWWNRILSRPCWILSSCIVSERSINERVRFCWPTLVIKLFTYKLLFWPLW